MEKPKKFLNFEEINKSLTKILGDGLNEIMSSRYSQALETLKACENKLEVYVNQGYPIDPNLILTVLHNIALCCQSMNNHQECSAYLEACIYNLKGKADLIFNSSKTAAERIRKLRFLSLLHIQLSDCFSKTQDHSRALENARTALKKCLLVIKLCSQACSDSKLKSVSLNNTNKKILSELYTKSSSILQILYLQINGKKISKKCKETSMRSVLGVQKISEWIFTLSLDKITEIKPLFLNDLKAPHSFRAEVSKDFMLDKICISTAACYMISRELFIINEDLQKARSYHQRAIAISKQFFPSSCPFLQGLLKEYTEKFVGKDQKKLKNLPRSSSAKESRVAFTKMEVPLKIGTPKKKKYFEIKKLPWKAKPERNFEKTETKTNHTQSESTIAKNNIKSPCLEKTEPEPPLSEESAEENIIQNFIICSNELYGEYYEEEVDKYEYMPLRRDI